MYTFFWFFVFGLSLLIKIPKTIYLKGISGPNKDKAVYDTAKTWSLSQINRTHSNIEVSGLNNIPDEACLFVSNHQSNFDIPLLLAYITKPIGFIAKIELINFPVLSDWMKFINCVFLDRNDLRSQAKSIIEGINILKSGHSLVVFPEGTRSRSPDMGEFKQGSFKLATKSKVPIVPVTIKNSYKVFEEQNKIKKADISITVHEPIYTNQLSKEDEKKIPVIVENIIAASL